MSNPGEGFLARWTRRKQAARDDTIVDSTGPQPAPEAPAAGSDDPQGVDADISAARSVHPAAPVELASLPSIDSITAASDVRPFLAPGVPAELARAALRRAWSADPAIRDFVGIAENQWDFTAPGGIFGFGPLGSDDEAKRLVARILGGEPPERDSPAADDTVRTDTTGKDLRRHEDSEPCPADVRQTGLDREDCVQCNENMTAPQCSDPDGDGLESARPHGHGGALPR
jgi:hypothetical protein